jgi:hypothetical protein
MKSYDIPIHLFSSVGLEQPAVESRSASWRWRERGYRDPSKNSSLFIFITALSVMALAIHGYHPYAEDGGLYLAGIKKLLDPNLYPYEAGFVTVDQRFSLFGPLVVVLVRLSHLGLMHMMLILYLVTLWMTLWAAWMIADRCYGSREACYGAVSLLSLWLTMPIAGTSLLLMDPYVSARSISAPFTLFAIVAALDVQRGVDQGRAIRWRSIALGLVTMLVAFVNHPLMAAYASACLLLFACCSLPSPRIRVATTLGVCLMSVLLAYCMESIAPSQPPGYAGVAQTRTYWFLDNWHWYELIGLIAPLLVLAALKIAPLRKRANSASILANMCIAAGGTGFVVAVLFASRDSHSFIVARLQPLRIFHTVYMFMIIAVGAALGEMVLKRQRMRWAAMFALLGGIMFFVQRETFPHSNHIEFPWSSPENQWEQGFEWIRSNTSKGSVFAMDARYITTTGEDSQNFRAIADRSALPDYSKDGGIASIAPDLTHDWVEGESAQQGLDDATDDQRIAMLHGASAQWVVLSERVPTQFDCVYQNQEMKVCRIPAEKPVQPNR